MSRYALIKIRITLKQNRECSLYTYDNIAIEPSLLTDNSRLEVNEDGTRHVFASSSLAEERVERVVSSTNRLVTRHLTIGLDAVFQTVQLPAGVANLHSGLADMYADALTLQPTSSQNHQYHSPPTETMRFGLETPSLDSAVIGCPSVLSVCTQFGG